MSIVGKGCNHSSINPHFFQKEKDGLLSAPFYIKNDSYAVLNIVDE
ncbi:MULTISPECIES: hypothetical protein [Clostridia]|nr:MULTISPECIES: hypothetical protein [Clostridia]